MDNKCDDNIYYRELNTLLQFSTLINSSLKIESVLDNAMRCAEEFISAEASTIYEIDEAKNELFIRLARGEKKDPIKKIRVKIGEGIAGKVVQTGQSMVVNDISQESDFNDKYDRLTGFKTRSLICVPLIIRGKSIGAIQVLNKKTREPFSNADLEILTSLSHQIAIAMDNANLYHRLEQKFELTAQELKSTQERLIRSERLAAMGHLVDGVAHEIRNPITVIGGFAGRIKEHSEDNATLVKYADIILGESNRLERLVQKVRELADVQTASLQPDNIGPVVDEILKTFLPYAETRGIKIIVNIEKDIPLIDMDRPQMVIALSNIIENSLEAINENGEISLNIKKIENALLIEIKDTGIGIKEVDITSIYDPFVTSKTRGAGLGLTMAHQIIINHKGEIKITSREREGTTVAIRLPIIN